jgi:predicted hydrolase (HD superfamily)
LRRSRGYQCSDTEGSARYSEEHPRICAEIAASEGEGEEITGDLCAAASIESPEALALVRQACEINDDVKHFVQAYELVFG